MQLLHPRPNDRLHNPVGNIAELFVPPLEFEHALVNVILLKLLPYIDGLHLVLNETVQVQLIIHERLPPANTTATSFQSVPGFRAAKDMPS